MSLSRDQISVFTRRVAALSSGQVAVPSVQINRSEAVALWRDLRVVFGSIGGSSPLLTLREFAALRVRAAARSLGSMRLEVRDLTVAQGLAAWRAVKLLGKIAGRPKFASAWGRYAKVGVAASGALSLAGCVGMFGGNVKGSFSCSAPGGTCAPSTLIDDQALSVIQNARPMTPAGTYEVPGRGGGVPQVAYASAGDGRLASVGNGSVHRDRRVLKVVFPSYVDGKGNLHEARVVHTVTDSGGWMQLSSGEANVGEQAVGRADARVRAEVSQALQPVGVPEAVASAPHVSPVSIVQRDASGRELSGWSLSSAPRDGAATGVGPTVGATLSGAPTAAAVDAALQRGPRMPGNPLDAIKSRVAEQLGQAAPTSDGGARSAALGAPVEAPAAKATVAPVAAAAPAVSQPPKVANGPSVFPVKVEE